MVELGKLENAIKVEIAIFFQFLVFIPKKKEYIYLPNDSM